MNHWRIRRAYGFGAGQVCLTPPPLPYPARTDAWVASGWPRNLGRGLGSAAAVGLVGLTLTALIAALNQADPRGVEIVLLLSPTQPAAPALVAEPELAPPEPRALPVPPPAPDPEPASREPAQTPRVAPPPRPA